MCPRPVKKEMLNEGKGKKKVVTEQKREAEYEACRKEVCGPREEKVLSSNDDVDSDIEKARRKSMRS